jgi:Leucine-rich repeat (LRR) protein
VAGAPGLGSLRRLDLRETSLSADGAVALLASPHLGGLRELYLSSNQIRDLPAEAVYGLRTKGLHILDLRKNALDSRDARALAPCPGLASVCWLDLSGNQIADQGAYALAYSSHLTALVTLLLSGNRIGQYGTTALARTGSLPSLFTLDLRRNRIGVGGGLALAESRHLDGLGQLHLDSDISPAARESVVRRFGDRLRLT